LISIIWVLPGRMQRETLQRVTGLGWAETGEGLLETGIRVPIVNRMVAISFFMLGVTSFWGDHSIFGIPVVGLQWAIGYGTLEKQKGPAERPTPQGPVNLPVFRSKAYHA